MARFIEEARTTAILDHPSVLPIHDLGRTADGRVWFTMRLTGGQPLSELIADLCTGKLVEAIAAITDRVELMVRICESIAYAHSRGILHCDLKPANIMIGCYGEVLVVDWGSALRQGQPGRAAGTPLYMSPEQSRSEEIDERSDVFGIGATLWHLLLLRPPLQEDSDLERFWHRKMAGDCDPPTAVESAMVSASLLAILRSSVAAQRQDRYPSVIALRDSLRSWLRAREAEAVADASERHLIQLERSGDHGGFSRVEQDLARAIALAPELPRVRERLSQAKEAHARFSLACGDLNLAAGLIDAADPLHVSVASALRLAVIRRRRLTVLTRSALAAALVAVVATALWLWTEHRDRFGVWQRMWEMDGLDAAASVHLTTGSWIPADRTPVAASAQGIALIPQQVVFLPVDERGNVRVTAQVVWGGEIDGLELMLHASSESPRGSWEYQPCFVCQFGGYRGRYASIGIVRRPGGMETLVDEPVQFEAGRPYRLAFELEDGVLRLLVDGREILRHREAMPLGDDDYRHLSLRSWAKNLVLKRLQVERLGSPPRPSPLIAGQALEALALHDRAADAFRRVAEDHPGSDLEEPALAQSYLARLAGGHAGADDLLHAFEQDHPRSSWLPSLWEASASEAALHARFSDAAALCARILATDPRSHAPMRVFGHRPWRPDPDSLEPMLAVMGRMKGRLHLNLLDAWISTLEPFRHAQIYELDISNNRIADLAPLQGQSIVSLAVEGDPVHDLAALKGMPLAELDINHTQVAGLEPLAGTAVLRVLRMSRTHIADLSPVASAPLRVLEASSTRIADLASVRSAQLKSLAIDDTAIADLAPMAGQPLEYLSLRRTKVHDLGPVRGAPLAEMIIADTPIADLAPLSGSPLTRLSIARTSITVLAPLHRAHLEHLDISWTAVRDLSPLSGQPLRDLDISGCERVDLAPIASSLRQLVAPQSHVDLAPLAHSGLSRLELSDARVASFRPILEMPALARLELVGAVADDSSTLEELANGLRAHGQAGLAVMADRASALARGDRARLLTLAGTEPGRRLLDIGWRATLAQSRALAARVGAHLPTIPDRAACNRLRQHCMPAESLWLGLHRDRDGRMVWDDGSTGCDRKLIKGDSLCSWDQIASCAFNNYFELDPIFGLTSSETADRDWLLAVILEWDPD